MTYAVSFSKHNRVTPDHLTSRDALFVAVADDQGPWAREIPQSVERPFGLALLVKRDPRDYKDRDEQNKRVLQFA